jgi:hypothetical protein
MHSYLGPHGIRFNDYVFSEPSPLGHWTPPRYPGLYVILTDDGEWAPRRFQPICFGEFGNNSRKLPLPDPTRSLYISVLPLPFTTTAQRCGIRDELVAAYNPAGQTPHVDVPRPIERRRIGFLQ